MRQTVTLTTSGGGARLTITSNSTTKGVRFRTTLNTLQRQHEQRSLSCPSTVQRETMAAEKTTKEEEKALAPMAEIKANIDLIERGVAELKPRFTHRVLRLLIALRKRIDNKVLRDAIEENYPAGACFVYLPILREVTCVCCEDSAVKSKLLSCLPPAPVTHQRPPLILSLRWRYTFVSLLFTTSTQPKRPTQNQYRFAMRPLKKCSPLIAGAWILLRQKCGSLLSDPTNLAENLLMRDHTYFPSLVH